MNETLKKEIENITDHGNGCNELTRGDLIHRNAVIEDLKAYEKELEEDREAAIESDDEQMQFAIMNQLTAVCRIRRNITYMPHYEDSAKTNADRIRSMTDEELAKYLLSFKNTFGEEYEGEMSCLDWLRKPHQEESASNNQN